MIALLLALGATSAAAVDDPGPYLRLQAGFGGWPTGLMSDVRAQYRAPLARKEGSLMLNDTYAGAGLMVRTTPAFLDTGPRLSIAPVDVFDLDLQFSRLQYFSKSYALMGFTEARGKLDSERRARAADGDGIPSGGWSATATPTVKLKAGPIVAFDTWSISYITLDDQGAAEPYTYEPWRDLVIAWTDVTFEHEAALLFTAVDSDEDGAPFFWFGAWARDRFSLNAPDRSTTLGPVLITRPLRGPGAPSILGRAMVYLTDADRVGTPPNFQAAFIWTFE